MLRPATEAVLQTAPPRGLERLRRRAGAAERSEQIGGEDRRPEILRQPVELARRDRLDGGRGAGIVGEIIEPAERFDRVAHHAFGGAGLRNVAGAPITAKPCAQSRSTAAGPRGSSGRWLSATLAPRRANSSTVASPMPDAPPVTSAVLPSRSPIAAVTTVIGTFERPRTLRDRSAAIGRTLPHGGNHAWDYLSCRVDCRDLGHLVVLRLALT